MAICDVEIRNVEILLFDWTFNFRSSPIVAPRSPRSIKCDGLIICLLCTGVQVYTHWGGTKIPNKVPPMIFRF